MALLDKPNMGEVWASGGTAVKPSDEKIQTGWTAEVPPYQYENWIQGRQDQYLAHINQRGVPQWDGLTEYEGGGLSYTQGSDGVVYKSVAPSGPSGTVQDPVTDVGNTYWEKAFADNTDSRIVNAVPNARTIIAGTGLTGGGDLSANRTLNVSYGTTAGTAAQGNDSRITGAVQTAGTGLTKSGTSLSVNFGTTAGTVMQGNDSRIDGALQKTAVVQITGSSTTDVMSQKAVTDALGQPSMTGSATLNGTTDNTVQLTDIVTTLGLEVGDVIRIQYSGYDKLHTVESITNDGSIIVNYEHAGNRDNGSLKLADQTVTVTITRIAKWYNAPIGLGQEWVDVFASRSVDTTYTNTTGKPIAVSVVGSVSSTRRLLLYVDDVEVAKTLETSSNGPENQVFAIVPAGGSYYASWGGVSAGVLVSWAELR